jgi:hypothetical protein
MVMGTNLDDSTIVWDADTPSQMTLAGGYLGAYMFSVPPGATAGPHSVKIENSWGESAPFTFTVDSFQPGQTFPRPRIDSVTLIGTTFDESGRVAPSLYVQGANIDAGAVVQLSGSSVVGGIAAPAYTDIATVSDKGFSNDWYGLHAADMGYPIYHYAAAIALPGYQPLGTTLKLVVKNLDGQISEEVFEYTLPANKASVDSDGDGLLDAWETDGYDGDADGVVDVDLLALGADPYRRDLLVEFDVMDNLTNPPDASVFAGAREVYRSAPILNPWSENGINLILDTSGKPCLPDPAGAPVCFFQTIIFDTAASTVAATPRQDNNPFAGDPVGFSALKAMNFDNAKRGGIYHYGIWGVDKVDGSSGESDFADDFVITLGCEDYECSFRTEVEAFVHELGHDLRQRHGGDDDQPKYKPNYWSVMSYSWELRTAHGDDSWRRDHPTCLPFYYALKGANEMNGAVPPVVNGVAAAVNLVVDYSEGMAPTFVQPQTQTGPVQSVCGKAVNWNTVGSHNGTIKDFANWRALKFDGPAINGWPAPQDGVLP